MKEILNYNQDELVRYQPRGNVDGQSLSRILNGNVCAKRIEKSDESDLRVTILVDCSGSMIGDRMKKRRLICCCFAGSLLGHENSMRHAWI